MNQKFLSNLDMFMKSWMIILMSQLSIALLNPAALTCCKNISTETETKRSDETVTKSFSSFNLSQMELACSNPFKMSQTMFSDSVKVQRRSLSISEEESSWEYYSDSESEIE